MRSPISPVIGTCETNRRHACKIPAGAPSTASELGVVRGRWGKEAEHVSTVVGHALTLAVARLRVCNEHSALCAPAARPPGLWKSLSVVSGKFEVSEPAFIISRRAQVASTKLSRPSTGAAFARQHSSALSGEAPFVWCQRRRPLAEQSSNYSNIWKGSCSETVACCSTS